MLVKKERPRVAKGETPRVETGCGHLYVTVNCNDDNPIEVFARLGKAGGCSTCQNEALTRSITLGLRYGVPVEEYVRQLQGLQCPIPMSWPEKERVLSCADGIAKVLRGYMESGDDKV